MKKYLLLFSFVVLSVTLTYSQEKKILNQYLLNYYLMNPAVAGPEESCYELRVTNLNQFINFNKNLNQTPTTQVLSFTGQPFHNMGLGGYLYNDRNGLHHRMGFQVTYAYHINLDKNSRVREKELSFGASLWGLQTSVNEDKFYPVYYDQRVTWGRVSSGINLSANFGIDLLLKSFMMGFSVHNLVPYKSSIYSDDEFKQPRYYYLDLGYAFYNKGHIYYIPSVVVKMTDKREAKIFGDDPKTQEYWMAASDPDKVEKQFDINFKIQYDPYAQMRMKNKYDQKYWFVFSYRHSLDKAFNSYKDNKPTIESDGTVTFEEKSGNLGSPLSFQFVVGMLYGPYNIAFSYNIGTTLYQGYHFGQLEIMLGYKFCVDKPKIVPCSKVKPHHN